MMLQPAAATPLKPTRIAGAAFRAIRSAALDEFEAAIVTRLGMHDGIALSSLMRNTFAAVAAAKRRCRAGASILLPRYACPSFIHGIQAAGMPHRYCDTDPLSLSVRPADLERAADPSVGAVLIPNLFGLSADMPVIQQLCRDRGWLLLEGADYTFGGSFAGRALGSFGDYSILNFQEGKALPIGGGMALSRENGDFASLKPGTSASSLVALARAIAYSILIRPWSYGVFTASIVRLGVAKKKFSMEDTIRETRNEFDYQVDQVRLAERISGFQGALGSRLLAQLDQDLDMRLANATALEKALQGVANITAVSRLPGLDRCHYIRYPILVGDTRRDSLCQHLIKSGFEASPMYVEHGMRVDPAVHPGAARICAELLTLPCHPLMRMRDIERLAGTIRSFLHHS